MSPARRRSLFEKLSASIPNPETELVHNNPFQLLISVILSAQATDVSVNKVTPSLFQAFPDPQSMGDAGHEQILRFIRSIGLAPSKAKNIEKTKSMKYTWVGTAVSVTAAPVCNLAVFS